MLGDADPAACGGETIIFGGYATTKVIGGGGMGTVYEARHPTLGKRVALKVIKGSLAGDRIARERFLREARAIARLSHPNVVDVFDLGIDVDRAFIVMELLEGETLEALLARKGRLAVSQAVDVFLPLISATAAIHDTDVVHRDLKPGNVMLARRGRFAVEPVVLDFGISRTAETTSGDEALTEPQLLVGTLPYLAPEQLRDARAAGPQSDQYGLGVMLYECVTGRKPFSGADRYELIHAAMTGELAPPSAIDPAIPRELDAVVMRALARRPDARFPSMRAFGSALLSVADRATWKRWAAEFAGVDPSADGAPSTDTAADVARPIAPRRRGTARGQLALTLGALALAAGASLGTALFVRGRAPTPPSIPAARAAPVATSEPAPPPSPPPPVAPPAAVAPELPPPARLPPAARRERPARRARAGDPAGVGTLYVNASPDWATVSIDENPAGTTPIVLSDVPAGSHTLEVRALGQAPPLRRSVTVAAGSTARVEFDFAKR
jgi:eukaryotic-like serine/threonine-protein kinase